MSDKPYPTVLDLEQRVAFLARRVDAIVAEYDKRIAALEVIAKPAVFHAGPLSEEDRRKLSQPVNTHLFVGGVLAPIQPQPVADDASQDNPQPPAGQCLHKNIRTDSFRHAGVAPSAPILRRVCTDCGLVLVTDKATGTFSMPVADDAHSYYPAVSALCGITLRDQDGDPVGLCAEDALVDVAAAARRYRQTIRDGELATGRRQRNDAEMLDDALARLEAAK